MELLLASMDGMSNAAFRSICFEYGADGATTEMIGAVGLARAKRRRRPIMEAQLSRRPEEGTLAAQIIGSEPESMALAAKKLEALGRFDLIEINMGCPARCVVGSGNGAALLKSPTQADEILRAVCEATRLPVRLKLRLGWDDAHITAPEIARLAQAAGCGAIILHGRTRDQLYSGEVDISAMREVRAAVSIPFYANGAVTRAQDVAPFAAAVGADGVCIGRAALKAPWIFEDVRRLERGKALPQRNARERIEMLLNFAQRLCALKPEKFAVCELRKFSLWYLMEFRDYERTFEQVKRADSLTDFAEIHERYLAELARAGALLPQPGRLKLAPLDTRQRSI